MTRHVPQDYRAWLTHGNIYRFVPCGNDDRVVTVTARRSAAGAVWLLYEHIGETLDLRYWVMPNGGLSEARELGPGEEPLLRVLPSVANVIDLEDPTERASSLDGIIRQQINDWLDGIDWGEKPG